VPAIEFVCLGKGSAATPKNAGLGRGGVRSFKILVVDDFDDFRQFICSELQQKTEFQISEASDGLEAIQKAEELQPDLILLDIGLPELSGIEVARLVRKLAPDTKILFLSLEFDPDIVQEALEIGALGYIHKSRAPSDLLPGIEAVLRGERFIKNG
jgi:DNA-binding NarL/FixJ family response regulator